MGLTRDVDSKPVACDYNALRTHYDRTPGLIIDKLKAVLESIAPFLVQLGKKGLIFAYDEAQNLADHASKDQYPLSLLLDLFQSIQRKNIPFMLALRTGESITGVIAEA